MRWLKRAISTTPRYFPRRVDTAACREGRREPHRIGDNEALLEVPITVADLLGKPMCFFGGGYLRLFPYWLIRKMALQVLAEGRPVVFYIHPREIDPGASAAAHEPQARSSSPTLIWRPPKRRSGAYFGIFP